jgi:uncharacterized membrane protein
MERNHTQATVPVLGLVGLAFALNLHELAADSFWGDEIFTASFASRSLPEVLRWTAEDIHPPLYYLLAGAFTGLTVPLGLSQDPGLVSDWLWRFPSVVAVVLTIAVTYRLALSMSDFRPADRRQSGAIAAALLLVLAPVALKYGQEARMHALFMFLAALSTWLLFRAWARPGQKSIWLAYGLALTATIYTMYFGFLILASQAGLLTGRILQAYWTRSHASATLLKPRVRGAGAAIALALIAYLPWWPVLLNLLQRRAAVGAIEGGVGNPLTFMSGVVAALGPQPAPLAWGFLLLFFLGLFILGHGPWPLAIFGALWFALPIALPILLGDPRALQFRYAFILPVYLTIIASAVITISLNRPPRLATYLIWLLATLSGLALLTIYPQVKPDWRGAAAYLTQHTQPADLIIYGPLWDEGRFIEYYYRGPAQLLTPAAMLTNIQDRADQLARYGGRIWAVTRFQPKESAVAHNLIFPGVVVTEPKFPVYDPLLLSEATLDLAAQTVAGAYPWAAEAAAQGVLNPDPRTAKAVALAALGDSLVAAGRPAAALVPYQQAVTIFPGWVRGYLALAETQEAIGDLPAAAKSYRQAVAFNLAWHGPLADEASRLVEAQAWPAALAKFHQIIDGDQGAR